MDIKIFLKFWIGLIQIELNQIFPMKPSEFEISLSVESYAKKTDENCWNGYVAEKKHYSFQTMKEINSKFN